MRTEQSDSVEVFPIDQASAMIDHSELADLRNFMASVPEMVSPEAVALFTSVEGNQPTEDDRIVGRSSDGHVRMTITAANGGSRELDIHALCLVDGRQADCHSSTPVWELAIPPRSVARVPIDIAAEPGARIDYPLLVEGDTDRPYAYSQYLGVHVETHREPQIALNLASHAEILGGCGFAALVNSTESRDTFTPLVQQSRSDPLFLLVELCDRNEVVQLVPIADRRHVIQLDEPWGEVLRINGTTLLASVPTEQLENINEFQAVVLRHGETTEPAWMSHAVRLND